MLGVDLASAAVFLDFDGAVTPRHREVLVAAATAGWEAIETAYERGLVVSRERLLDQWDLVGAEPAALAGVVDQVPVDPAFAPFVRRLRAAGATVTVVSDGFGISVDDVCALVDVEVLTNVVDADGELQFPHQSRCCPCTSCGVCKQAPLKDARHARRTTVLVSDATGDRKAALLADVLFARGPLAAWCERIGVGYVPFRTLADVEAALR
jgi:2-hydroxy-3-keto-5-methylthiopentenyl-1-phosphate phosphatase